VDFDFFAGDLSLDFINTLAPDAGAAAMRDSLTCYLDLVEWAGQAGILDASERARRSRLVQESPRSAAAVFRRAIRLRDSLYRLVLARLEGRTPAPDDLRRFNQFLGDAQAHLRLEATPEGFRLQLADDPRPSSLLWPIASAASRLLTSEDARHIRRCDAESCLGFFIDHSRNHSRRWCDMKVCGNRAKARQHYSVLKEQHH
jgi:predicted RNA-binding Zn ribbon-like protein